MMAESAKYWKAFEQAVAEFLAALDAEAVVTGDKQNTQRGAGSARQRDIWVEAKVANLFPIKVMLRCKRVSRNLTEEDLEAFSNELRSSGAQKGVLYTFRGYSREALRQAHAQDISCCRLSHYGPAKLAETLRVSLLYYVCSLERVDWRSAAADYWGRQPLAQALDALDEDDIPARQQFVDFFWMERDAAIQSALLDRSLPAPWSFSINLQAADGRQAPLRLSLRGVWRVYQASGAAHLVNDVYRFSENGPAGSPAAALLPPPGPGWEPLEAMPGDYKAGALLLPQGDRMVEMVLERVGGKRLEEFGR
jgi:hypothetical protein